jgi:hypothetical protein
MGSNREVQECNPKSSEWECHDTSISYAQIVVEKQLWDSGSTVASCLLVDVPKKLNNHGCLEEPKMLADMLEDRLEVLLRPDDKPSHKLRDSCACKWVDCGDMQHIFTTRLNSGADEPSGGDAIRLNLTGDSKEMQIW